MKKYWVLFLLLALSLIGYGCHSSQKSYRIGIDSHYEPLSLFGKSSLFYAFIHDILQEISYKERVFFKIYHAYREHLAPGLTTKHYDGILSLFYPKAFYLKTYNHSDLFLQTGPTLLVNKRKSSMDQSKKSCIGVSTLFHTDRLFLLQRYPRVAFQEYSHISSMFEDLAQNRINGILIDYLPAIFFIRDLYMDQIAIATILKPEEGIAMLTLGGSPSQSELINIINRGLKEMRTSGKYQQLLKKWHLVPPLLTDLHGADLHGEVPLLSSEETPPPQVTAPLLP